MSLVAVLLAQTVALSDYPVPERPPPELRYLEQRELIERACNGNERCPVWGWYPGEGDAVYLIAHCRKARSLHCHSVLVHELVHWLQWLDGANAHEADCERLLALEREAYSIQRLWDFHAGRRWGPSPVLMMRCPGPPSP